MKRFASIVSLIAALPSFAVSFPIEWNSTYNTDTNYEIELDTTKLASTVGASMNDRYTVVARTKEGECKLSTIQFPVYGEGKIGLRFKVPSGTTALRCETEANGKLVDATNVDNLIADGLETTRWKLPSGLVCEKVDKGIILRGVRNGQYIATYEVKLPEGVAGKSVRFEMDVESLSKMAWGNLIQIMQYDAANKRLPEDVIDPRSISHMRPPHVLCNLRANGRVHPKAVKIGIAVEIRCPTLPIDNHGMPNKDSSIGLNALSVTRMALRTAEQLPFPKYDDDCFAKGVSGAEGDFALVLGGEKAFWWQTHSLACWAQGIQLHEEEQLFFPAGAGTLEAWFKPDWNKDDKKVYCLFEGAHHRPMLSVHQQNSLVKLSYSPVRKELEMMLRSGDFNDKTVWKKLSEVELTKGEWSHIAMQWGENGTAEVFVNGKCVIELSIKGWKPFDITGKKANEMMPLECYVGSTANDARLKRGLLGTETMLYPGAIDLVRASTGKRYQKDFVPIKELQTDAQTRALFKFDRSFDGVSGGGIAYIPGTYRAAKSRIVRKLNVDGRYVQYYSESIKPEANPKVVLNTLIYTNMPTVADYDAARMTKRKSYKMSIGDKVALKLPKSIHADFVEIANTGDSPLVYPIIINAGEVDPRSCGDMGDTMGLKGKTGRERANRVFQYVLDASDYFMNHTAIFKADSDVPEDVEYKALIMLNGYCGFECGPLNNMTANFFACVGGVAASQNAGYGHSFQQAFYEGKNRLYDLSALRFYPGLDNETVGSLEEGENETAQFQRIGDYASHFIRNGSRGAYVQDPAFQSKVGMILNPGERFRVWQVNDGQVNDLNYKAEYPGNRVVNDSRPFAYITDYNKETNAKPRQGFKVWRMERFFPHYLNGFLVFDGKPDAKNPAFADNKDYFCYRVLSGYPIVHAEYAAKLVDGKDAKLEISTDGGVTFRSVGNELNYEVRARMAYIIKVKAPISSVERFVAKTEVMLNPRIFPGKLHSGDNELLLKAESGSGAVVTMQWREDVKKITVEGGLKSGFIPGCEHQTFLIGSEKPLRLKVDGVSAQAKASCSTKMRVSLNKGELEIKAVSKEPRIEVVTIDDKGAKKLLTIIVCPGARMFSASDAKLIGEAKLVSENEKSIQNNVVCVKKGDGMEFTCDEKLPAGKYVAFMLNRFAAHDAGVQGGELFDLQTPGAKTSERIRLGQACNSGCNFFFVNYGMAGGRAAWKWDYAMRPEWYYPYYPRYRVWEFDLPATDKIALNMTVSTGCASGAEVAGLLLVPAPEREFKCELVKVLCGMNCQPGIVSADE